MAYIAKTYDDNGERTYNQTVTEAVIDENGNTLKTILDKSFNKSIGFENRTTTQEDDGSIVETFSDGSKIVSIENEDGTEITSKYYLANGELKMTKVQKENEDGSITEEVQYGGDE